MTLIKRKEKTMFEKLDIKSSFLKALYVIVAFYIALNMFGAFLFIFASNSWEDAGKAIAAGIFILFYSAILNFIAALIAKKINRIIFWIHIVLAVICYIFSCIVYFCLGW